MDAALSAALAYAWWWAARQLRGEHQVPWEKLRVLAGLGVLPHLGISGVLLLTAIVWLDKAGIQLFPLLMACLGLSMPWTGWSLASQASRPEPLGVLTQREGRRRMAGRMLFVAFMHATIAVALLGGAAAAALFTILLGRHRM